MKSMAWYVLKDKVFKLEEKVSLLKTFLYQTEKHILELEDRYTTRNCIDDFKKYTKWLKRKILILKLRKVINEHTKC